MASAAASQPPVPASATVNRQLRSFQEAEVKRHLRAVAAARTGRQYGEAAERAVLAYGLQPLPEHLLAVADALRDAEVDALTLLAYRRLKFDAPTWATATEVSQRIEVLDACLAEESEVGFTPTTRRQIDGANEAFQQGRTDLFAARYAIAYAAHRLPRLPFNIAQIYRRGNPPENSLIWYQHSLAEEPERPLRREVTGYMTEFQPVAFRKPLVRQARFWLLISGAVAAAGVAVSAVC